jgi:hypothetical protein
MYGLQSWIKAKINNIPESSILSCLDIFSPGKVLNGDKNEFLDIAVTTSKHVSVLTIINERNTRPWNEDHLRGTKTKWDLLYDPGSYGYCYGIAFLSLSQITRYKSKRKEPNTDDYDIKLIQSKACA